MALDFPGTIFEMSSLNEWVHNGRTFNVLIRPNDALNACRAHLSRI